MDVNDDIRSLIGNIAVLFRLYPGLENLRSSNLLILFNENGAKKFEVWVDDVSTPVNGNDDIYFVLLCFWYKAYHRNKTSIEIDARCRRSITS